MKSFNLCMHTKTCPYIYRLFFFNINTLSFSNGWRGEGRENRLKGKWVHKLVMNQFLQSGESF